MTNHALTLVLHGSCKTTLADSSYQHVDIPESLKPWLDAVFDGCVTEEDRITAANTIVEFAQYTPEGELAILAACGKRNVRRTDDVDAGVARAVYSRLATTSASALLHGAPEEVRKLWNHGYGALERISAACCLLVLALDRNFRRS